MIVARGILKTDNSEMLLLGLSADNIAMLCAGNPVHISPETHGEEPFEGLAVKHIFIQVDVTEDALIEQLRKRGAVDGRTVERNFPGGIEHAIPNAPPPVHG